MNQAVIMVAIADRDWTLEALHCACRLARATSAQIALVQMVPVQHSQWLGTDFGYLLLTDQDRADFADYEKTIEDYAIEYGAVTFQYHTLLDAISDVAEYVDAQVVFARVPDAILPLWAKFQTWSLRRQLGKSGCEWIENPAYHVEPTISPENIRMAVKAH